ncbi:hypothetical protein CFP65_7527 [Kitasatospora sp. MMS16-BH015]|uniref:hypothetical protein n=1 Tax=Kitasatospora sp. MMS16-BH015 TaxID=2018025 RepID=UPI000CA1701B|nr:hypothetical protein [Kitasatospora sp. MMS16-BH015]AUG82102.1 hypothetical protein CFP65_7527 [Kitasatospora sp. MMS16-BH015]
MHPAEFQPTHVAPPDGLPTWADPGGLPTARLDPLLPLRLTETAGDWARIVCSNGWTAWVDGRLLVALPQRPRGTAQPLGTRTDPRPLLATLQEALTTYRALLEELAEGTLDLTGFRERAGGLRLGVVLDGPSAWLLDLEHGRWYYSDGARLSPYATVDPGDSDTPDGTRVG